MSCPWNHVDCTDKCALRVDGKCAFAVIAEEIKKAKKASKKKGG